MIKEGSIVRRASDDYLTHLNDNSVKYEYPPPGSVCVVVSPPKERDLAHQLRATYSGHVSLKKAIDVLHEGRVYRSCEVRAFFEVKKDDRENM